MIRLLVSSLFVAVILVATAQAGQNVATPAPESPARPPVELPAGYDGPAPPLPPQVITRSADGSRATLRAVRITSPLKIDGKLDEPVYQTVASISDFIQQEPQEGAPATEKTEIWLLFDDESFYVVARCWDSHPERMIATEMRHDGSRIPRNEDLAFGLDTFFDHRNGYNFEQTPVGGMMDAQISNDGVTIDVNWNAVLEHGAARFAQGWAVEMRIPFKTLRYRAGPNQLWALQVRRMVRWKNELDYITRIPASVGERGHMRLSLAPAVVGLEVPPPAKNIDVKPWAISSLSTDRTVSPNILNHGKADWGIDAKYGISKSLTADVTYNTDFAQVEADQQQVNLTRFNLNFPEKRDFFLENSGTFTFAGATGGTIAATGQADNTPALFYSRRIGLAGSQAVPIVGGGRVSGRIGNYSVGILNIESGRVKGTSIPATNFSVVRVKRDILRRSYVGGLFTSRSVGQSGNGANEAYGMDAGFNLKTNLTINGFLALTYTPGRTTSNTSYKGSIDYEGDRYGAWVEHLTVNPNFNPEVGFVRRLDMRREFALFRFSPRPANTKSRIRKYYYNTWAEYITTSAGQVQNRTVTGEFALDFQNSDHANLKFSNFHEYLPVPLTLGPGVRVPVGAYDYRSVLAGYNFGPQRFWFTTNTSLEFGTFYQGHKMSAIVTTGAISWPPHVIVEPYYALNRIAIPQGLLNQNLVGPRITYGFSPQAFLSALLQYNTTTNTTSSNVRLRWEYRPGSELFVVWNEQRDTLSSGLPLQNRALVVKFNHLWRY
jgi:hypothetical protein